MVRENDPIKEQDERPLTTAERVKLADAWLQMRNCEAAMSELEQIPAEDHNDWGVLKVRCRALKFAEEWERLAMCAVEALELFEEDPDFWVFWAWSEHMRGRTETALQVVSSVIEDFEESEVVAYCLACFYASLRRVDEARHWLVKAVQRSEDPEQVQLKAMDQPELRTIWEREGSHYSTLGKLTEAC
jgi:hypothetical protein